MQAAASAMLFLTLATPVAALEDILVRPDSCEAVLTIQRRGCEVETVLRCANADGAFMRYESYKPTGLDEVSHYIGTELIKMSSVSYSSEIIGGPMVSDLPAIDVLLHGEEQLIAQRLSFIQNGQAAAGATISKFKLVNRDVSVGDKTLTKFNVLSFRLDENDKPIAAYNHHVYYLEEIASFLDGEAIGEDAKPNEANKPMRILGPGEAGFGSVTPEYDCDSLSMVSEAEGVRTI